MRVVKLSVLVLMLAAFNAVGQEHSDQNPKSWTYGTPFVRIYTGFGKKTPTFALGPISNMTIRDDENGSGTISYADSGVGVNVCIKKDKMFCVNGPGFWFAVPKDFPKGGNRWSKEGKQYWLFDRDVKINMTGKAINASLIIGFGADKNSVIYEYVYSRCRGLLGFRLLKPKTYEIIRESWIEGLRGFAAHKCEEK